MPRHLIAAPTYAVAVIQGSVAQSPCFSRPLAIVFQGVATHRAAKPQCRHTSICNCRSEVSWHAQIYLGHSRGKFSSRKTPQMAINRDFPGLRAFSANFARDKIEEREIPHPMVKSAACFGAPKLSYGHFSHPAGHSPGCRDPRKHVSRRQQSLDSNWRVSGPLNVQVEVCWHAQKQF